MTTDIQREAPWDIANQRPDVAVLVALKEEFRELKAVVGSLWSRPNETYGGDDYLMLVDDERKGGRPYRMVAFFMDDMGPSAATHAAARLLALRPALVVNIGIACSLDAKDLRLCDVVLANQVDGYDEKGKAKDDESGGWTWALGGEVYRATDHVVRLVNQLEFSEEGAFEEWVKECAQELVAAVGSDAQGLRAVAALRKKKQLGERPSVIKAHLASGVTVAAAKAFKQQVIGRDRNIKALEMEAVGMLRAAQDRKVPIDTLVLRGISDLGDARKKTVDGIGGGAIRRVAMRNAVRLLWTLMRTGRLARVEEAVAPRRRNKKKPSKKRAAARDGAAGPRPAAADSAGPATVVEDELPRTRTVLEPEVPRGTPVDDDALADVLAEVVDEGMAEVLLKKVRLPKARRPRFDDPLVFWTQVIQRLRDGVIEGDGVQALIDAAAKRYPGKDFFERHCTKPDSRSIDAGMIAPAEPPPEVDDALHHSTLEAVVDHLGRAPELVECIAEGSDAWRGAAAKGVKALARMMLASTPPVELVDRICEAISRIPPGPSAKALADAMLDMLDGMLPVVTSPFLRMRAEGTGWTANAEFPLTIETIAARIDKRPIELHERHAPNPRPRAHVEIDAKRRPKAGANVMGSVLDVASRLQGVHEELALAKRPGDRLEWAAMDVLDASRQGTDDIEHQPIERKLSIANRTIPKIRGRDGQPMKLYAIAPMRKPDAPVDPFVALLRERLGALRVIEPRLGDADRDLDDELRTSLRLLYAAYRSLLERTTP